MTAEGHREVGELTREIQLWLRELNGRLHQVNDAVGSHLDLRSADIEILDLVARRGPMSPGAVAETTGVHPATLTGIIDRLERGGWVSRVPDPGDRRKLQIEARTERGGEMARLYAPMNRSIASICAELTPSQLRVVRDFLRRASEAGVEAVTMIRDGDPGGSSPRR
jgi:DNA-binding MarR family transcriptional regulator